MDYSTLIAEHTMTPATWEEFVRTRLVDRWLTSYKRTTRWETQVLEIDQGELTFLFDAAPTLAPDADDEGEDRVVAVWGRSATPAVARDRGRLAGFLADRRLWSLRSRDRGHLVAHSAGGGADLNLFPQALALNRGLNEEGRRWRRLERLVAREPGTPLFVRPLYSSRTWTPAALEYGALVGGTLRLERFTNR